MKERNFIPSKAFLVKNFMMTRLDSVPKETESPCYNPLSSGFSR